MATVEDLINAVQLQTTLVNESLVKAKGLTAQFAAINPESPTATADFQSLQSADTVYQTSINDQLLASNATIRTVYSSISPSDKSNADEILQKVQSNSSTLAKALFLVNDASQNSSNKIANYISSTSESATVKTPSATNTDKTAAATTVKYETPTAPVSTSFSDARNEATGVYTAPPPTARFSDAQFEANRVTPDVAMPRKKVWANVVIKDAIGNVQGVDLRVKIRVPVNYLTNSTSGINKELSKLGGIIFPYTPSINYEHKADYTPATPTHSNFTIYFYKNSTIGSITIAGKFTVQNDADAGVYLATIHLLRALTKMRSGGITGDTDSGAPPPVCRLDAYGDAMLANVPVAITSFRLELPDNIDYYNLGPEAAAIYGQASVPTLSTVTLSCIPMYSRQEMQDYSVTDWLNNPQVRKYGLL